METGNEWRQALAEVATELLRQAEITAPPVNALAIARSLELTVALDRSQAGRGRIKRIAGRSTIFLRPEERPERLQWAAAHELGESLTWRVCRSLGWEGKDLSPGQREDFANQLAKEILLPADWFRRDCDQTGYDLIPLKARYATASHELIAWRWLDGPSPAIVTIFDHGVLSRRRGNGWSRTPPLTPLERRCWGDLRNTRQPARGEDSSLRVRGWCVDSPAWQREILLARPRYDYEEES